jgi:hypothetical protein
MGGCARKKDGYQLVEGLKNAEIEVRKSLHIQVKEFDEQLIGISLYKSRITEIKWISRQR